MNHHKYLVVLLIKTELGQVIRSRLLKTSTANIKCLGLGQNFQALLYFLKTSFTPGRDAMGNKFIYLLEGCYLLCSMLFNLFNDEQLYIMFCCSCLRHLNVIENGH